jgi:hypothetical protein
MAVRFKTGNKASLTLTADHTTGVGTTFVGNIVSLQPGEWSLGERDVSVLSDEDFMRVDPQDLATTNEISGVVRFDPRLGLPSVDGEIETVTLTFPKASTATSGVTQGNISGKGFFTRVAWPSLVNNETMDAEFTIKLTGESLAYAPEATS